MSNRSTTAVGLVVAILIVGAIASIGYYQFEVAPNQTTSSTSSPTIAVTCAKTNCAYVNITSGAGSCILPTVCGFSPATITVVMGVNNTVVWTNDDTAVHTITPVTGSGWGFTQTCQGVPGLCQGDTFQYTFPAAGTYQYHCIYHSGMEGTVIVKNS
ncbi:MAG: cupredoxin domain-containing protein [Nitrososphaerales archaeon]